MKGSKSTDAKQIHNFMVENMWMDPLVPLSLARTLQSHPHLFADAFDSLAPSSIYSQSQTAVIKELVRCIADLDEREIDELQDVFEVVKEEEQGDPIDPAFLKIDPTRNVLSDL